MLTPPLWKDNIPGAWGLIKVCLVITEECVRDIIRRYGWLWISWHRYHLMDWSNIILQGNRKFLAGGEADWVKFRFVRNVVAQRCRSD